METVFLGDITKKAKRGADIGKYSAIVGIIAALTIMGASFLVSNMGFKVIFYITSAIILASTMILFYVTDRKN